MRHNLPIHLDFMTS